jgi:multicomponent Na+:H+ antiporter subunit G
MAYVADAVTLLGLFVMTVGVLGLFRMPDVYLQLHAASKAVVLGVVAIGLATAVTADWATAARVTLISAALVLTSPVATHAIARAAYRRELEERADESSEGRRRTPSNG